MLVSEVQYITNKKGKPVAIILQSSGSGYIEMTEFSRLNYGRNKI